MGNFLGFEVTVIDDRPEFACEEKLPWADNILVGNIATKIKTVLLTEGTFVVIVTRGHQNDAETLRQCIKSNAGYIGMIGSSRKIHLMRKEFIQKGWATTDEFDRVYAPIGINIKSKTVEEIAVSIAAQLALVRRQLLDLNKLDK